MAAPSNRMYLVTLIIFLLFLPGGLLFYHYGPALVLAWRFRKLGRPLEARGRVVGYILTGGSGTQSYELDPKGQIVRRWTTDADCFGVAVLPDGHALLGSARSVTEIDDDNQVVWKSPAALSFSRVVDVSRLGNGNTLVADCSAGRVLEFTPAGQEVWSYQCDRPYSAQRLKNGNTLIGAGNGSVTEVKPDGKVVWQKAGGVCVVHARRLANKNTLITDFSGNRVEEVDLDGRTVWSYDCGGNPAGAERLSDGRTLISTRSASDVYGLRVLLLVGPDGKEEWRFAGGLSDGRACPIYARR
jgi:hypothetical protein